MLDGHGHPLWTPENHVTRWLLALLLLPSLVQAQTTWTELPDLNDAVPGRKTPGEYALVCDRNVANALTHSFTLLSTRAVAVSGRPGFNVSLMHRPLPHEGTQPPRVLAIDLCFEEIHTAFVIDAGRTGRDAIRRSTPTDGDLPATKPSVIPQETR